MRTLLTPLVDYDEEDSDEQRRVNWAKAIKLIEDTSITFSRAFCFSESSIVE